MKVGFWVPSYRGNMPMELVRQKDIDTAAVRDAGHEYRWWWSSSSDLPRMRNEALEHARKMGLDYLMMQDDDIYCPEEASPMLRLLESAQEHGGAITGAICGLRRIKLDQVAPNVRPFVNDGSVYEAERIGTGMVLLDVKAFDAIADEYEGPWFGRTYHDDRQSRADFGEDFFACEIVRAHGHKVVIDGRVQTVHAYVDKHHLHYQPVVK